MGDGEIYWGHKTAEGIRRLLPATVRLPGARSTYMHFELEESEREESGDDPRKTP